MLKTIVIDVQKTLGDLYYIGSEPAYKYENNKKTNEVIGYFYNLASKVQGDTIKVKVLGDEKKFEMMQQVELVGVETKFYAKAKGNFADMNVSITAYDIKNVSGFDV
jgi:hypothetical protein